MRPIRKFRQRVIGYYAKHPRIDVVNRRMVDTWVYIGASKNMKSNFRIAYNVAVDGEWFLLINRETREYKKFKTLEALHTAVEFGAIG